MDLGRFVRNLALWAVPVILVWLALTPIYNRLLIRGVENVVQGIETPNKTRLRVHETHYALVYHKDVKVNTSTGHVGSFRMTDVQFTVLFVGLLFLSVPEVPTRRRFEALGWGLLAMAFFHLLLGVFRVQFVYATQLGQWSLDNYSAFARNFWGLGKHVLDLAFKFALPLALWSLFYLDRLLPQTEAARSPKGRRKVSEESL
ncbi:MAG: hypothetical protein AAGA81_24625 [Acidobacteriota bacterium]